MLLYICVVILGLVCLEQSFCFMPNPQSPGGGESWTHEAITRQGIYQAAVHYLTKEGVIGSDQRHPYAKMTSFFGNDHDGFERYENMIKDIIRENNKVQEERKSEAMISFNGEEIKAGHFHLVTLRKMIDEEAAKVTPDSDLVKSYIGQYLYTLQSFYSNTNWVEMHGRRINEDIGKSNRSDKIKFVGFFTPTCVSKNYNVRSIKGRSCENNIIVTDKLTSGYRSGQDLQKPVINHGNSGKCSHGGEFDSSRTQTATCGINKDTLHPRYSPHWFHHDDAVSGALKATEQFFTQNDSPSQITTEKFIFQSVLNLKVKKRSSLAFVIDKSTSMKEEIEQVTKWTVDKVSSVIGSPMEPANYVLVTFSDPEMHTTTFVTEDGNKMINELQSINVIGGGTDCPELTFSGLNKECPCVIGGAGECPELTFSGLNEAVEVSLKDSTITCYTDDDSKDNHLQEKVTMDAKLKNISITFYKFPSPCSRRKRSGEQFNFNEASREKRTKRSASAIFKEVALATGGKVHSVTLETLASVMDQEFMEKFSSAEVCIDFFISQSSNTADFYVDKSMFSLRIAVTGKESADEVYVASPSGERLNFNNGNALSNSKIISYDKQQIMTVQAPLTGRWQFVGNHGNKDLVVNITAQSDVDFTFTLMQPNKEGFVYESVGNPVVGQNYTTIITVFGFNITGKNGVLRLLDLNGELITEYNLQIDSDLNTMTNQYFTSITMVQQKFVFQLITQDELGNTLKRIKWLIINPVNIKLHLIPIYDMLIDGIEKNISYRIYNPSNFAENLVSEIEINSGNIVSSATRHHLVEAGSLIEDYFTIRADILSSDIIIYNIKVKSSGSQETLQSLSSRLKVTNIRHPVCQIVFKRGSCENVTRGNCIQHKWFAVTETMFSGVGISSVSLARTGQNINLTIGDTDTFYGPLQVNISGTCCESYNRLEVLDTDDYLAHCNLLFSSEVHLHVEENVKEQEWKIVPIICITLGVIFAFILLSIALVKFVKHRQSTFNVK